MNRRLRRAVGRVAVSITVFGACRHRDPTGATRPFDDPESCVDYREPAPEAWEAELERHITSALPSVEKCAHGLGRARRIQLAWKLDSGRADARIDATTIDDCTVAECIRTALSGIAVSLPEPPDQKPRYRLRTLVVSPDEAPRLLSGNDIDSPMGNRCSDPSNPERMPRVDPAEVQRIVRSNFDRFHLCYVDGLYRHPTLRGRVSTRFEIGADGSVVTANTQGNTLPDCEVVACIREQFEQLTFPRPREGSVTIVYPIYLEPRR